MPKILIKMASREGNFRCKAPRMESARDDLRQVLGLPLDMPIAPVWEPPEEFSADIPSTTDMDDPLELRQERMNLEATELENRASRWTERINASLYAYWDVETRRNG